MGCESCARPSADVPHAVLFTHMARVPSSSKSNSPIQVVGNLLEVPFTEGEGANRWGEGGADLDDLDDLDVVVRRA